MPRPRAYAAVTHTAGGVVVCGGSGAEGVRGDAWLWNGASWTQLPREGQPGARMGHVSVWTGATLCVWGGEALGEVLGDGACWDPASNTWRPITRDGAPAARTGAGGVWTGREVLLVGGEDAQGRPLDGGGAWDPSTNRWRAVRREDRVSGRRSPALATVGEGEGRRVLVWGGRDARDGEDAGALYDPTADRWEAVDATDAPPASGLVALVGGSMLVWSERGVARFDASGRRWVTSPSHEAPSPRRDTSWVFTGDGVCVWGGRDANGLRSDGACYALASGRWGALPSDGAPEARADAVTFWDGARLHVLWGADDGGLREDAWALEPARR